MKNKKIILIVYLAVFFNLIYAQRMDQRVYVATSEDEVYRLYDQMMDSARVSNMYLDPYGVNFGISYFNEINTKDTLMKFESTPDYHNNRYHDAYLSNCQPIDFYERFLNYLKEIEKRENFFLKRESTKQLFYIREILMKQYESGILNDEESVKAFELMEQVSLRIINDGHGIRLKGYEKYITDNIRQTLVNVIDNPFYPAEYLDFYMSQQDSLPEVDSIGISNSLKEKVLKDRLYSLTEEEMDDFYRFSTFLIYKEIGEREFGGISPGQAYLERKKQWFPEKGYLSIISIARYAVEYQDEMLIEKLKEFKKKHPDYQYEIILGDEN